MLCERIILGGWEVRLHESHIRNLMQTLSHAQPVGRQQLVI